MSCKMTHAVFGIIIENHHTYSVNLTRGVLKKQTFKSIPNEIKV